MKKIMLISSIILTIVVISMITINNMDKKEKNIIKSKEEEKEIVNSNMLTLMYETEAGSKEYVATKDNTWPEEGYIFNKNLSGCENGGELEYNSQNNTVNLLTNKSDKCYVYFDKYNGVWIDNVSITNVTGSSVTLDVSATSENGSITKYYYSLNDNEEYQEATSNVITINNLNKLTEYKISIYAIDNTNTKSNLYEISVSTTDISVPVINSVSVSDITDSGFTLTVNATSDVEINKYYFTIDGDGEQVGGTSTTNNYTFTTLDEETSYDILIFVEDINENYSEKYKISLTTEKKQILLYDYIKNLCTSDGANDLYFHDGGGLYGDTEAKDNSYRYAGANPNNYVCFGSDASTCPSDNLYRIIGVFDNEVKIIKNTSLGNYVWNGSWNNTWDTNTQPAIKYTLNTTFLKKFTENWSNKISNHVWYIKGMDLHNSAVTAKDYYDIEIAGSLNNTVSMKVGLIYLSDFGYATQPTSNNWSNGWTDDLSEENYNIKNLNWLFLSEAEWTITRSTDNSGYAFLISSGRVSYSTVITSFAIRPCFYLTSSTNYVSGFGTSSDPFRIL